MSVCCEVSGATMAAPAVQTSQERKDLEKLTKFFALKSAQVIVQSRLGDKINTECNPNSTQTEWFNMVIKDIPEVQAEAKKAIGNTGLQLPFCVEISLKTNDQETMTLEAWYIKIRTDLVDPAVRMTSSLYNRMTLMLKSLLTLTRVTPAYKLSRNKSADYLMCYRIYVGEPQLFGLGSDYKHLNVGEVCTLLGTLQLSVVYRTKLTISPQQNKTSAIMMKSNHFPPDVNVSDKSKKSSDITIGSNGMPMVKLPAFADRWDLRWVEPTKVEHPFAKLLPKPKLTSSQETELLTNNGNENADRDSSKDTKTNNDSENGNVTTKISSSPSYNIEGFSALVDPFKEIRPSMPFVGEGEVDRVDLGLFYRRCENAPPLKSYMGMLKIDDVEEIKLEDVEDDRENDLVDRTDISEELEKLEESVLQFDDIISSLCDGENNN